MIGRGQSRPNTLSTTARVGWTCVVLGGIAATAASYLLIDQPVSAWLLSHPNAWHSNWWVDGFRQLGKADVPIWLMAVWSCFTNKWRPAIALLAAMILVGA